MHFGVIAALGAEARAFARTEGLFLGEHRYTLITSGPGPLRAANAAQMCLARGCTALLSFGVAGALDPGLKAGELVIGNVVRDGASNHSSDMQFELDPTIGDALVSTLHGWCEPHRGELISMPRAVDSSAEKRRLYTNHHALAVDMETHAIAKLASNAEVPCASLRSIVDTANFDLPHSASAGLNEDGSLSVPRSIAALLRHPTELSKTLRLGRDFQRALGSLRAAATRLCH